MVYDFKQNKEKRFIIIKYHCDCIVMFLSHRQANNFATRIHRKDWYIFEQPCTSILTMYGRCSANCYLQVE